MPDWSNWSGFPNKQALAGWRATRASRAAEARWRALASRVRPRRINPNNITGSSKKHSQPKAGKSNAAKLAK